MNDRSRTLRYLIFDFVSAFLAWQSFNVFRFFTFRHTIDFPDLTHFLLQEKFWWMGILVPIFWLILYGISGYYVAPRRKTSLGDLLNSAVTTLIGVLLIFFLVIINDYPEEPTLYYQVILEFFFIHWAITALFRLAQTVPLIRGQARGKDCVPVLIVGTGEDALRVLQEFNAWRSHFAYKLIGFVRTGNTPDRVPQNEILGSIAELDELLPRYNAEELIFALDHRSPEQVQQLLDRIYHLRMPVKAFANRQDILAGNVSLFSLFGLPMVNLTPSPMPVWQKNIKWFSDKLLALIALIVLMPLFLYLAIRVKMDSPGPVFFLQERVGKEGKLFKILKFRSMQQGSEPNGPQLSSINDGRITPYGRHMRRYRLDELPQFWNVLKGDMSIVGPRPERQYFVNQILEKAPHYYLIQRVLPGITSWGMVKYGYADTVEKMIRRLEYDIIYLENQSLLIDLKIMVFTLKPILKGKGR